MVLHKCKILQDSRIRNFLGVLNSNPIVKKRDSITCIPCKYFLVGEEMLCPPQVIILK